MSWFPNTSFRNAFAVVALGWAFLFRSSSARAQERLEQLYQQAVDVYNDGKMEDACQLLQQVAKENPNYKQTQRYLNTACNEAKRMYAMEEKWFRDGVESANQGRLEEAKEKFEKASRIPLKHPKYKDQIRNHLKLIQSREEEEGRLQQCVNLYNQQKYDEAQACFAPLAQAGGPRSSEARGYLTKVAEAIAGQSAREAGARAFDEGVRLFKQRNYEEARARFNKVTESGGPKGGEARRYLARIEAALTLGAKEQEAFNEGVGLYKGGKLSGASARFTEVVRLNGQRRGEAEKYLKQIRVELAKGGGPKPSGTPHGVKPAASDDLLRAGLRAYINGNYAVAEESLTNYLSNNGEKRALAYFFRGAAHSARYFLSGEKDTDQKAQALADFRALKEYAAQFRPPEKYVSPKILAVYGDAVKTGTQ